LCPFVGVDLNLWPTVYIAVIVLTRTKYESNQTYLRTLIAIKQRTNNQSINQTNKQSIIDHSTTHSIVCFCTRCPRVGSLTTSTKHTMQKIIFNNATVVHITEAGVPIMIGARHAMKNGTDPEHNHNAHTMALPVRRRCRWKGHAADTRGLSLQS